MLNKTKRLTTGIALTVAAVFTLAACASSPASESSETESTSTESTTATEKPVEETSTVDPAANLFGPACSEYAEAVPTGDGSIQGMSENPVADAASANPILTTLVAAVSGQLNPDVNLVETLNSGEFTVFAPTDDAFAKIDAATIETLKTDSELLTSILTYHVVPGQIAPDDIVGEQTTVNGATVEVAGSGEALTVNDANIICGGVQTTNATVYMVDSVLLPPAE